MRSLRLAVTIAVVSLLLSSAAWAHVDWDFTVYPAWDGAPPGGTVSFYYDLTNYATSTEALDLGWASAAFMPGIPESYWGSGLFDFDFTDWWSDGLAPGQSVNGPFWHLTWSLAAPIGWSTRLKGSLFLNNEIANPGDLISRQCVAQVVTPELPPAALGLLGMVPLAWARFRRRKSS